MKIISLALTLFLILAFLNPEHFYPWTTYDAEKYIFYVSSLIFLYFIYCNNDAVNIDTNILILILLFFCSIFLYNLYNFKQYFYIFNLYLMNLIVLSVSFFAAFVYLPDVLRHIQFSKLLLSSLAWLLFATLLYGYHRSGWSSDMVTKRTIIGLLLLTIAYFGSKLIEQI